MSPEMPFPIGSSVETNVINTEDTTQRTALLTALGLIGKRTDLLEYGIFKLFEVVAATGNTTIYTVPANKRLFVYNLTVKLSNTGVWMLARGSAVEQYLYEFSNATYQYIDKIQIFDENEVIQIREISGSATMTCSLRGIEVDIT